MIAGEMQTSFAAYIKVLLLDHLAVFEPRLKLFRSYDGRLSSLHKLMAVLLFSLPAILSGKQVF